MIYNSEDSYSVEGAMNLHPVINNLRIEDHQSAILNPFPLIQTSHAGNRNSIGSTSSQTSSGFESGKTGSSTGGDLFNLVSSNSSSSCTSSNLVTAVNPMDSPSSKISSSGSTTSAGRLSTYYTSLDECCCDLTGGLDCSSASSSNIISPEINTTASEQPKSSRKATYSCGRVKIREMMAKGIPESEIMAEWLQRLCFSQCLALLNNTRYFQASDRKKLMQDIQQWNIADIWPAHVTADGGIRDWLICIGLTQYIDLFESRGYTTMHELQKVTWEDLEDIVGRTGCLREDVSSLTDCGDYGTLQPHHLRQVPVPCSPSTSSSTTASSTFQPDCSSASDSGYGTSIQPQSNCYDNTGFVSPYMAPDRRPFRKPPQQKSSSLVNAKQRPIVTEIC
uniref:SAM domain-containing protein n=1 Tax=Ditylenchus dipsaci TaxID=166011 RepID=A0A915E0W9_9BILA